ncbi:DUF1569 domain-containing protein [Neotamlana laminarinivorans]|uniref:DUF1569 domain-containing protein n=1 Tax=Neotamlana laminarinivorans TaxID=2883124 RepID=A0A9X1I0X0_9FLAO|nr:DUF1569 domain-containing protein [Tamlana laminarinivorans]MCB4799774.1 DUF1569 domain-containing protein [Tamlana laminarinivorans]
MSNNQLDLINQQLLKIENHIPKINLINTKASKASIGWHLDHSLKVFNSVCTATIQSNPEDYKRTFNFWRALLFKLNYIPRGKAKAPKYVLPPENIQENDIRNQLKTVKSNLKALQKLPKTSFFKHFIFGKLNKKQTLRFLQMHTHHHLKIIAKIE